MENKNLDNFANQVLDSAIQGINEAAVQERNRRLSEFSSIELLTELGQRLRNREIEGFYTDFAQLQVRKYPGLAISSESDNQTIFALYLSDGKTKGGKE